MRVASLFSGVGGFDLGLERAGHTVVLQCELDAYRASVLRRHWPQVRLVDDVRTITAGQPLRRDELDLVCAGFPCRDLSIVGRGRGLEDPASADGSGLFFELCRVADDVLRPGAWLLLENVTGLLSSGGGRDHAILIRTLGDLGFHDLAWRVLDSRLHGVPQSRRRVFVLARRAAGSAARRVLLEPEGGPGHPRASDEHPGPAAISPASDSDVVAFAVRGGRPDGTRVEVAPHDASPALRAATGGSSTSTLVAISENQQGRVNESDVAYALTSGGGKVGQGYPVVRDDERVRRLTPTECERLQGFPDGWTIPTGPSLAGAPSWYQLPVDQRAREAHDPPPHQPRWEAMGRAVTVPVAEAIGRRLRAWELAHG